MPRVTLPPTPASSTDIKGKDGTGNVPTLHLAFELPPPALGIASPTETRAPPAPAAAASSSSSSSSASSSSSSSSSAAAAATNPTTTSRGRRRSSATSTVSKEHEFTLPPPPTRSRKIIQMKPKGQQLSEQLEPKGTDGELKAGASSSGPNCAAAADSGAGAKGTAKAVGSAGRKKHPSATSAAGRKIARKTAHSLIERRRRSKMNEEFAVLKNMVPACTGEMHKLAILQASIEYVRYLEDCVAKLKDQNQATQSQSQHHELMEDVSGPQSVASEQSPPTMTARQLHQPLPSFSDLSADVEMAGSSISGADSAVPSPTWTNNNPHHPPSCSVSPALLAQQEENHQQQLFHQQQSRRPQPHRGNSSYSSASTNRRPSQSGGGHYAAASSSPSVNGYGRRQQSLSATTSPAFGPQKQQQQHQHQHPSPYPSTYSRAGGDPALSSAGGSTLTSPALEPQRDLDQEATAALLMLNSDRRGFIHGGGGGGGDDGRGFMPVNSKVYADPAGAEAAAAAGRGMSVKDLLST